MDYSACLGFNFTLYADMRCMIQGSLDNELDYLAEDSIYSAVVT